MTFRLNPAGVTSLVRSSGAVALVNREARALAKAVQTETPIGETHRAWESIRTTPARPMPDGAEATVYSVHPWWHIIEFGDPKHKPYAPMRRAVLRRGLRFRPTPKPGKRP